MKTYQFALCIAGICALFFWFGYQVAEINIKPITILENSHTFKDPIVVQEGDTIQVIFELDGKYAGKKFVSNTDGFFTGFSYNMTSQEKKDE